MNKDYQYYRLINNDEAETLSISTQYILSQKMDERLGFIPDFQSHARDLKLSVNKKYIRKAGYYFADFFDISIDSRIIYFEQIIYKDKLPILIEETYIPEHVAPKISKLKTPIYSFKDVLEFYNCKIYEQKQSIELINGPKNIRKKLQLDDKIKILYYNYTYLDMRGRNILFSHRWYRSNQIRFKIRL